MHFHGECGAGKHEYRLEDYKVGRKIQMSSIPPGSHSFASAWLTAPIPHSGFPRPVFSGALYVSLGGDSINWFPLHPIMAYPYISAFPGACLALLETGTTSSAVRET